MTIKSIGLALSVILFVSACVSHDLGQEAVAYECDGDVSFSNDIQPILNDRCVTCHNSAELGSSHDWTNPEVFQQHATEAKRRVMLPLSDADHMPADGTSLNEEEITKIACWADQGAPIDN